MEFILRCSVSPFRHSVLSILFYGIEKIELIDVVIGRHSSENVFGAFRAFSMRAAPPIHCLDSSRYIHASITHQWTVKPDIDAAFYALVGREKRLFFGEVRV